MKAGASRGYGKDMWKLGTIRELISNTPELEDHCSGPHSSGGDHEQLDITQTHGRIITDRLSLQIQRQAKALAQDPSRYLNNSPTIQFRLPIHHYDRLLFFFTPKHRWNGNFNMEWISSGLWTGGGVEQGGVLWSGNGILHAYGCEIGWSRAEIRRMGMIQ
jgi:hypothetical protein